MFSAPLLIYRRDGKDSKNLSQEHVRNVSNQNQNNEIYKHRRDTGHLFDFKNVKIIAQEQTKKPR